MGFSAASITTSDLAIVKNNNPYKAFIAEGAEEREGKSKGKDSKRSPFWRRKFSITVRFSANLCVLYGEAAFCRIIEP
jgi:hypothetical protein